MYTELQRKFPKAEYLAGMTLNNIELLNKKYLKTFSCLLPNDYQLFLREYNGFYYNGHSVFGCYDEDMMCKDRGLSGLDVYSFNDRFQDYTDIVDFIILGKSSIDYIAYEIDSHQYVMMTNGTLDILHRSNSFKDILFIFYSEA